MEIHQEELVSEKVERVVPHVFHTGLGGLRHVPGLDPNEATEAWKVFNKKKFKSKSSCSQVVSSTVVSLAASSSSRE